MKNEVRATVRLVTVNFVSMLFIALLATPESNAATYYTGQNGSEAYSCSDAMSPWTPVARITVGIQCLGAGDTLIVGEGTYYELIGSFMYIPSGTPDNPITIMADPEARVTLTIPDDVGGYPVLELASPSYITIRGFTFDGRGVAGNVIVVSYPSTNIRFENNEIKQGAYNGLLLGSWSTELVNNAIHSNAYYGIYMGGDSAVIDGNEIHGNGRYGIHGYSQGGGLSNNIICNNQVHDNGQSAPATGILMGGVGNQIFNNTIWNENSSAIEIRYSGPQDITVFGNVIFGDHNTEIDVDADAWNIQVFDNSIYPEF